MTDKYIIWVKHKNDKEYNEGYERETEDIARHIIDMGGWKGYDLKDLDFKVEEILHQGKIE